MSDGFSEFSFGAGDDNVGKKTARFKGKQGETYRASFAWTKVVNGEPRVNFLACERHYLQGVGYFLPKGPETTKMAGPPKPTVATILVVWPTDKHGQPNMDAIGKGEGIEVMSWIFSTERYDQLKRRNVEFPLHECDLTMTCTDTQYQKMDLSPCKDSIFVKLSKKDSPRAKEIVEAIRSSIADIEKNLRNDMARDLSLDKIREKAGLASAGASGASRSGPVEDVESVLDNILDD